MTDIINDLLNNVTTIISTLPLTVKTEALIDTTNDLTKDVLKVFWPAVVVGFILLIVTIFGILANSIALLVFVVRWTPLKKPIIHLTPGKTFEVAISQDQRPEYLNTDD